MKTRKHNLNAIAIGVALAMGFMSAANAVPTNPSGPGLTQAAAAERASISVPPTFNSYEKNGIALVESALSLIAARTHVDAEFCPETTYTLSVNVPTSTTGTAVIDGGPRNGGTILTGTISGNYLGYLVHVDAAPDSLLDGLGIGSYAGNHRWSIDGAIFLDKANFTIEEPQTYVPVPYDEHSIKDFYKQVVDVDPSSESTRLQAWEFDWGLEVVTKDRMPVTKWTERSWFHRQNGALGEARVVKELLAPGTGVVQCRIVYSGTGYSQFNYNGTVRVINLAN
jgi:hypothetical protein